MKRKSGFTLIQSLVVAAIVSLTISICLLMIEVNKKKAGVVTIQTSAIAQIPDKVTTINNVVKVTKTIVGDSLDGYKSIYTVYTLKLGEVTKQEYAGWGKCSLVWQFDTDKERMMQWGGRIEIHEKSPTDLIIFHVNGPEDLP